MTVWYRFKIYHYLKIKKNIEMNKRSCINIKFTHLRFRLKPSNKEMPQFQQVISRIVIYHSVNFQNKIRIQI